MSQSSFLLNPTIAEYIVGNTLREPEVLSQLRQYTTDNLPEARMQIAPEQGQLMQLLCKLMQAKRCIEIGTFTGYSALSVALALPADGQLIACDISEDFTAVAREYWEKAGIAHKIDLRIAPALDTLAKIAEQESQQSFDLAFIDADKTNYKNYYEALLPLIRSGGMIIFDNVLWSGRVADENHTDPDTLALRELNQFLLQDQRIDLSMLPIADGLTLVLKK